MSNLRLAARTITRQLGSSVVIVSTLAVSIGVVVVLFSTIDVVRRMVPVADRSRFVFVASTDLRQSGATPTGPLRTGVSIPDLVDWSRGSTSFDAFTAMAMGSGTLTDRDVPLSVATARVTTNLLSLWGIAPILGRSFRLDDDRVADSQPLILTHQFWDRQFARSTAVLGRSVRFNNEPYTVIGVLPESASGGILVQTDVLLPLMLEPTQSARDDRSLFVLGRLRNGVSRAEAAAELETIAARLRSQHPSTNARIGALVQPLIEASGMSVRLLLSILILIASLILVMACANIANVILAHSSARHHEFAVRAALGASRGHRLRQLLTEHLLLSSLGGSGGITLAYWSVAFLRRLAGSAFGFSEISLTPSVLAAAVVVALLAPLGFGLLPAWRSIVDADTLRVGGRAGLPRPLRIQRFVTAVQVCVAVVVTLQIALLSLSAWRLSRLDTGFDRARLLTFRLDLPPSSYPGPTQITQFVDTALTGIRGISGVESVAITDTLPIADRESMSALVVEGAPPSPPDTQPTAARAAVSPDYFRTMRIPVVRGRTFSDDESNRRDQVAMINNEAARRYFQGRDPVGGRIALGQASGPQAWLTIIGVTGDVRNSDADQGHLPEVYLPASRDPVGAIAFVVRSTAPDPLQLVPAIRTRIAALDRNLPLGDVASMEQVIWDDLSGTLTLTAILATIGFVALCLASAGIYGVAAFAVSQRTSEIGIRMALGALPRRIVRMVLVQNGRPVLAGGAVGLVIATALAYAFSSTVLDQTFSDPLNYTVVIAMLATVAFIASYIPARRASRINPVVALRSE